MSQPRLFFLGGKRKPAQDLFFKEALLKGGAKPGTEKRWTDCWFTGMPPAAFFDRLKRGMTLNHIPGNHCLTIKSRLASTVRAARERARIEWGGESASRFDFVPPVFEMPEDYRALQEAAFADPRSEWILKPKNASKGKGISLVEDPAAVPLDDKWMVQQYLRRPHLYQGHKYVLRLYVLVTSVEPLRVYLYREGSAKLASAPYDPENRDNLFAHLTNPDINAANSGVESPVTFLSLQKYKEWLAAEGIDGDALFHRIREMLTLLLISARETFLARTRQIKGDPTGCYELLGVDCMIDADLKPWVMECNLSPSLDLCASRGHGREEEEENKRALVEDTLSLAAVGRDRADVEDSLPERWIKETEAEERRRGGYTRLFPCADSGFSLSCFPFPRYADVAVAERLYGVNPEARPLRRHRVGEVVRNERLCLYRESDGRLLDLNDTAAWIWFMATEGKSPEEIVEALTEGYENAGQAVAPSVLRNQVWSLLADWTAQEMLSAGRAAAQPDPSGVGPFRQRDAVGVRLSVGSIVCRINCPTEAVADRVRRAFVPLPDRPANGPDEQEISLDIRQFGHGYVLLSQDEVLSGDNSLSEVLMALGEHLHRLGHRSSEEIPLHGIVEIMPEEGSELPTGRLWLPEKNGNGVDQWVWPSAFAKGSVAGGICLLAGRPGEVKTLGLPWRVELRNRPFSLIREQASAGSRIEASDPKLVGKAVTLREIRRVGGPEDGSAEEPDEFLGLLLGALLAGKERRLTGDTVAAAAQWMERTISSLSAFQTASAGDGVSGL